ncbi:MAG: hypothetical protein JWQ48_898 [Conexibacter sp.]|nr:hypothetical protein [Conexibacter sp.]
MITFTDLSIGDRHVRRLAKNALLHGALGRDGGTVTPVRGVAHPHRQRVAVRAQARDRAGTWTRSPEPDERLGVFYPGASPWSRQPSASTATRP